MTLPRLRDITEYQRRNPPIHIMVAAYFGAGSNNSAASETNNGQTLFDVLPQRAG